MRICAIGLRGIPDVMGGIETHCEHLYPRLSRLDDAMDIVVIGRKGYVQSGEWEGVRVVSLWAPRFMSLETVVHTPLAILYARLFLKPDLIHLHAVGPGFFTPFARLLGIRVVATHHGPDYERPKFGRFGRWFLRTGQTMMARFANEVICVSSGIHAMLAKRFPQRKDRFVTIRNGAPPMPEEEPAAGELLESLGIAAQKYILCVGRLDPFKGFNDVIEAFRLAQPEGLKLVIVGGSLGDDAFATELMAAASDDIVFAGARSTAEVLTLYRNAALFVHPSYLEGFPIVVLEALAADVPIVASDIPPHLEVGLDPECYFPKGDVQALSEILAESDFTRFRCSRRDEILDDNDWDSVAGRHRDIFRKVCGADTSRAADRPAPPTGAPQHRPGGAD